MLLGYSDPTATGELAIHQHLSAAARDSCLPFIALMAQALGSPHDGHIEESGVSAFKKLRFSVFLYCVWSKHLSAHCDKHPRLITL
jgi:hypothetical protein